MGSLQLDVKTIRNRTKAKFAKMYFYRIGLVFYVCIYYTVDAWSSGAPSSACRSMTPGHGNSVQTSSSPISVSLSTGNINQGNSVTVYTSGNNGITFKGFLIHAFDSSNNIIGSFSPPSNAKCLSCGGGCSSLTHRNAASKSQVVSTWMAPSNYVGKAYFRYTVVTQKSTYWVAENGPILTISS